jgi:hypothetical protein
MSRPGTRSHHLHATKTLAIPDNGDNVRFHRAQLNFQGSARPWLSARPSALLRHWLSLQRKWNRGFKGHDHFCVYRSLYQLNQVTVPLGRQARGVWRHLLLGFLVYRSHSLPRLIQIHDMHAYYVAARVAESQTSVIMMVRLPGG